MEMCKSKVLLIPPGEVTVVNSFVQTYSSRLFAHTGASVSLLLYFSAALQLDYTSIVQLWEEAGEQSEGCLMTRSQMNRAAWMTHSAAACQKPELSLHQSRVHCPGTSCSRQFGRVMSTFSSQTVNFQCNWSCTDRATYQMLNKEELCMDLPFLALFSDKYILCLGVFIPQSSFALACVPLVSLR